MGRPPTTPRWSRRGALDLAGTAVAIMQLDGAVEACRAIDHGQVGRDHRLQDPQQRFPPVRGGGGSRVCRAPSDSISGCRAPESRCGQQIRRLAGVATQGSQQGEPSWATSDTVRGGIVGAPRDPQHARRARSRAKACGERGQEPTGGHRGPEPVWPAVAGPALPAGGWARTSDSRAGRVVRAGSSASRVQASNRSAGESARCGCRRPATVVAAKRDLLVPAPRSRRCRAPQPSRRSGGVVRCRNAGTGRPRCGSRATAGRFALGIRPGPVHLRGALPGPVEHGPRSGQGRST